MCYQAARLHGLCMWDFVQKSWACQSKGSPQESPQFACLPPCEPWATLSTHPALSHADACHCRLNPAVTQDAQSPKDLPSLSETEKENLPEPLKYAHR